MAILQLKLAVAVCSSASVANVASNDELKDSRSVTLVLKEPLSDCKSSISVAILEEASLNEPLISSAI